MIHLSDSTVREHCHSPLLAHFRAFSQCNGNDSHEFFVRMGISGVEMVECLNDRIHTTGPWCDITALNVYVPLEDKPDDTKDNFCVKTECLFDQFLSTTYKFR